MCLGGLVLNIWIGHRNGQDFVGHLGCVSHQENHRLQMDKNYTDTLVITRADWICWDIWSYSNDNAAIGGLSIQEIGSKSRLFWKLYKFRRSNFVHHVFITWRNTLANLKTLALKWAKIWLSVRFGVKLIGLFWWVSPLNNHWAELDINYIQRLIITRPNQTSWDISTNINESHAIQDENRGKWWKNCNYLGIHTGLIIENFTVVSTSIEATLM